MPPPRVDTPESTSEAAPAPLPRVDSEGGMSFQTGRAPRQPSQCAPHIIPDDTDPMSPIAHQNTKGNPMVP